MVLEATSRRLAETFRAVNADTSAANIIEEFHDLDIGGLNPEAMGQ